MKKSKRENDFLGQLSMIPNVSLACEKVGLSRNTVYRWGKEDPDFKKRMDGALKAGVDSVNDLAESKLIAHINNGNLRAIQYWLDNNKRVYARPRPKSFWDAILERENRIGKITIQMPATAEEVEKEKAEQRSSPESEGEPDIP